jgi:hypothetical protein
MKERLQHLRQVFQIQQENGLIDNTLKRLCGQSQLQFFVHSISPEGIILLMKNIKIIQNFPHPQRSSNRKVFLASEISPSSP